MSVHSFWIESVKIVPKDMLIKFRLLDIFVLQEIFHKFLTKIILIMYNYVMHKGINILKRSIAENKLALWSTISMKKEDQFMDIFKYIFIHWLDSMKKVT